MRQFLIEQMAMMMPYMKTIAIAGAAFALLDLILSIYVRRTGHGRGVWSFAAKLTFLVAVFFIACEIAGRALGMEPTLLFASDPFNRTLYWNQWPFWSIGLALLFVWLIAKLFSIRLIKR